MLADTKNSKYQVGETWKFRSRPGEEEATLTVVKVELSAALGTIVHISVDGLRIKNPRAPGGFTKTIDHMPFSEASIAESVTDLVARGAPLPRYEDGYREWRAAFDANQGGIFTITVSEGIDFMEKALNR